MLLAGILVILILNIGYGVRQVLDDIADGKKALAALGAACLLGVNAVIGGLVYSDINSHTDF